MENIWVVYSMQLVFLPNLLTFAAATKSRLSSHKKCHCKAKHVHFPGKGNTGQNKLKIDFTMSYSSSVKVQKHNSFASPSFKGWEI